MTETDYTRALFGRNAVHVPAWLYIQNQGADIVSFVGSSLVPDAGDAHPLRYGSTRTHQFVLGEIIVRPTRFVVATDALAGEGLANLVTGDHDFDRMLRNGEAIIRPAQPD